MEINHTKITGVSQCPPLSEQPTTSKPNGFLGYIPENILPPSVATVSEIENPHIEESEPKNTIESAVKVQYEIENEQHSQPVTILEQPIAITLQKSENDSTEIENKSVTTTVATAKIPSSDTNTKIFVEQGQRINELASEIEELRSRLDQLSSQNEMLLQQQFSKNITEHRKP